MILALSPRVGKKIPRETDTCTYTQYHEGITRGREVPPPNTPLSSSPFLPLCPYIFLLSSLYPFPPPHLSLLSPLLPHSPSRFLTPRSVPFFSFFSSPLVLFLHLPSFISPSPYPHLLSSLLSPFPNRYSTHIFTHFFYYIFAFLYHSSELLWFPTF